MIAYLDTPSGISGDIFLGCLVDAGWPLAALNDVIKRLGLAPQSWQINVSQVMRGPLRATLVDVRALEEPTHRHLSDISAIIDAADLHGDVKRRAIAVFTRLAQAEADVHGMEIESVHFHEVGAVDAIIDIVGVCAGLDALNIERLYASPLPLGPGWTESAHGRIPLPAPATLALLAGAGAPTRPAPGPGELVTPTGAALLCELATFIQPPMALHKIATGAGQKEFDWPNVARLWLGEAAPLAPQTWGGRSANEADAEQASPRMENQGDDRSAPLAPKTEGGTARETNVEQASSRMEDQGGNQPAPKTWAERTAGEAAASQASPRIGGLGAEESQTLVKLETNIDDMNPELYGYVADKLFAAGALDVWTTPIQMKKQRPGTLFSILARADHEDSLANILLNETTTLGVRAHRLHRHEAAREIQTVETPLGPARVKLKFIDGHLSGMAPEHDDCCKLAQTHGIPLRTVYEAVHSAAQQITQYELRISTGDHHD